MMRVRALLFCLAALFIAAPALAREQINSFDVAIEVAKSGDIVVEETINVTSEGVEIRRGIFRDLPRYYESGGDALPFDYHVLSVRRDGHDEPFDTSNEDNAFRIRVGDPDVYLDNGPHTFELRYSVKNQVRYFDRYDELYWNVTGTFWAFPIQHAHASIYLPPGAHVTAEHGYTGALGATGADYAYAAREGRFDFETTRPLNVHEGLTVALAFDKGLIDPPSSADKGWLWWRRNGALAVLLASLGGLFLFLYRSFNRVGRDPQKDPVFPRYEAPAGYSPAATHHIYYRGLNGNTALIATLMNLAVGKQLTIDASDKKKTTLTRKADAPASAGLASEDLALESALFSGGASKTIGGDYDPGFTAAYNSFQRTLTSRYGRRYFRWNAGYTLLSVILTGLAIWFAATHALHWTIWHTIGVLGLAVLNGVFMYLMPAPTQEGQKVRTEIEGFRLYMETAEKLQLNAVKVGSDAPPPMTVERYEKFLPYAVALGVEKPWTQHFERLIPQEAASYSPVWMVGSMHGHNSLADLNSALMSSMNSGVSSALPQSSSSSGSGGGGFSGGGGGGGGGGGW